MNEPDRKTLDTGGLESDAHAAAKSAETSDNTAETQHGDGQTETPLQIAMHIDELCDSFEESWSTGGQPTIEEFLLKAPQGAREALFRQLLLSEYAMRLENGQTIEYDEYQERFPEYSDLIGLILASQTAPSEIGDYQLVSELGQGGMGVVFRAVQKSTGRSVAVKLIHQDRLWEMDPQRRSSAMARFRNEVQAAARLEDDHVVRVYEVGEENGCPFYAMQLVEGASFADILQDGPLKNRKAARYVHQAALALEAAHAAGVLHRDLKPHNLLLDRKNDRAMLTDFGLAKLLEGSNVVTATQAILGTPSYMAPEQADGARGATQASDIYGLGATLYHMLSGRPPFQADTPTKTLLQVCKCDPPAVRELNPSVHRDLETVCMKCLEKEPSRRYASARELADDLERFLQGEPIHARPVSRAEKVWRWCRRNPAVASLAAGIAVVLVLGTVFSTMFGVRATRAEAQAETRFQLARSAIDDAFRRASEDQLLGRPGMRRLRGELLQDYLAYYQKLLAEGGLQDDYEKSVIHYQIGEVHRQQGQYDKALAAYEKAQSSQQSLAQDEKSGVKHRQAYSKTLMGIGRIQQAGQDKSAVKLFDAAMRLREQVIKEDPQNVEGYRLLANAYMNTAVFWRGQREWDKAQDYFERALRVRRQAGQQKNVELTPAQRDAFRHDRAKGWYDLSNVHLEMGRGHQQQGRTRTAKSEFDLAERQLADALKLFGQGDSPDDRFGAALSARLQADINVALASVETGEPAAQSEAEAFKEYFAALEQFYTLCGEDPLNAVYQHELAKTYLEIGALEHHHALANNLAKSAAAAESRYQRAHRYLHPLAKAYQHPPYQLDYAALICKMVELSTRFDSNARGEQMQRSLNEAQAMLESLSSANLAADARCEELLEKIKKIRLELENLESKNIDHQ